MRKSLNEQYACRHKTYLYDMYYTAYIHDETVRRFTVEWETINLFKKFQSGKSCQLHNKNIFFQYRK